MKAPFLTVCLLGHYVCQLGLSRDRSRSQGHQRRMGQE